MQKAFYGAVATVILGSAANLAFITEASAVACGGIEYPSCGACTVTHNAAQSLPRAPGCEACFGICYAHRAVGADADEAKTAAAVETVNKMVGSRITSANYIDADLGRLHEIAQVNPMVALAVNAYSTRYEQRAGNFKRGKMAFPAVPTVRTFQISVQSEPVSAEQDYRMEAVSSTGNYAELTWTSKLLASGDLEVTYRSQEVNSDDVAVRALYPDIRIVLSKNSPSKLLSWQVAN